ncbi:MAG: archaetidylserine decarboxylase [Acidobacteriota bacterium]
MPDRSSSSPDRRPSARSSTDLSIRDAAVLRLLRRLPRAAMSRAAGRFASLRLPAPLRAPAMRVFGRTVGVDFDEVRDPLGSFGSLQDFFTRRLVDGARPLDPSPDAVLAPCDGAWGESGVVRDGTVLQVKGRPYSLAELFSVGGPALRTAAGAALEAWLEPSIFEGGAFATLYLSPRDYHRFHAPIAARLAAARVLPGTLWPVNHIGLHGVDALFARNERIIVCFEVVGDDGRELGRLAYIAVGATMVGKVHIEADAALTTNVRGAERLDRVYSPPLDIASGDEVGRFEFGSTLVLVATRGLLKLDAEPTGTPLRLGRRIGRLTPDDER